MENLQAPDPSDGRTAAQPPKAPAPARQPGELRIEDLGRWVYTHNPFYAISAALVFWGLRSSFDTDVHSFHTYAFVGGLIAYTLLLAVIACLVIRLGKIWEDGRTLLLVIVLMFLAISISFDGALKINPRIGPVCCLGGLALTVLVTEVVLRGIRLRFPPLFRVPYYLILGLFFIYPAVLAWTLGDPYSPPAQWALLAFPLLAGLLSLSLLPAVSRGADYVRNNGSPWRWPWYPWAAFFIMGLGVCGRSLYLCVSMHEVGGASTIFAPYFVIPFLLAANVLLLEASIRSRSVAATRVAMGVPVGLLVLAVIPPEWKVGLYFLHETFMGTLGGSPLWLTAWAAAAFYALAHVRRVPRAADALCCMLLGLSLIGPQTADLDTLADPRGLPILIGGIVQGWIALRGRGSLRWFLAACCIAAAATLDGRGTWLMACRGAIPAHGLLAVALFLGARFHDPFARALQNAGAAMILGATIVSLVSDPGMLGDVPRIWLAVYAALAIATAVVYGRLVRNWLYVGSAAAGAACWLGVLSTLTVYVRL